MQEEDININIIYKMINLTEYIIEKLHIDNETKVKDTSKYKKQLDDLLSEDHYKNEINPNDEVYSMWRNNKKKEVYLYKTTSYDDLLELWIQSKLDPDEFGRYLSFQPRKNSSFSIMYAPPFKHFTLIDKTI